MSTCLAVVEDRYKGRAAAAHCEHGWEVRIP